MSNKSTPEPKDWLIPNMRSGLKRFKIRRNDNGDGWEFQTASGFSAIAMHQLITGLEVVDAVEFDALTVDYEDLRGRYRAVMRDWQALVDEKRDALIAGDKLTARLEVVTAERDRWKRRAERFREGYREAQGEVIGLQIHEMQLQADGNASQTIRREAANAKTKMIAVCIERNEAREQIAALTTRVTELEAEAGHVQGNRSVRVLLSSP